MAKMSSKKLRILALDTSTEACSVAVICGGELAEDYRELPRAHTRFILPMVDELLNRCEMSLGELDAIAFGAGPGSFTGLRVCAATVQGLAFASDIPVVPVSTLRAMAQSWLDGALRSNIADGAVIHAALDARMDEIYSGEYEIQAGIANLKGAERLCHPADLQFDAPELIAGVGSGWGFRGQFVAMPAVQRIETEIQPRAAAIAKLGAHDLQQGFAQPADAAQPVYLRENVAWKN